MHDYSPRAKVYWWLAVLLGCVALLVALKQVALLPGTAVVQAIGGTILVVVAGLFPIRIGGTKASVSVGDVFVFLLLLHFGAHVAIVAAAAEAGVISLRTSQRWTSWVGSPAMAGTAMLAASTVFTAGRAQWPAIAGSSDASTCLLLAIAAMVFFAIGTLLMVSLIKLKGGDAIQPVRVLRDHYWLAVGYLASASIACSLHASVAQFTSIAMLATVPTLLAMLVVLHGYLRRGAEQAS